MTDYYLDSSALVKRYAEESGSAWIRQITDANTPHTILLAEITLAEVAAALAAKHRAPGGITQTQRDRVLSRFLQDCAEHFVLLPVDRLVIDREDMTPFNWPRLWLLLRLCNCKMCPLLFLLLLMG